ncbi:hypothetical protein [Pseudoxanthomonas wuyuanensis]
MGPSRRSAAAEASYRQEPYRKSYADILKQHRDPGVAVSELFLFRFWLSEHACRQCARSLTNDEQALSAQAVSTMPPPGWRVPENVEGVDIEAALGGGIATLVESRFDLYDRFFTLGRSTSDPLGLKAVSLALACQLFEEPPPAVLAYLTAKTREQFIAISRAWASETNPGSGASCAPR